MSRDLRRQRLTIVIVTLASAAVVAWGALALGVAPPYTVLLVLLVLAGGAPVYAFAGVDEREWGRPSLALRRGTRREVTMLSWAISRDDGATSRRTSERLRTIASVRLARMGIDLDDPTDATRATAALGPLAFDVVMRPAPRSVDALLATTDAISALGSTDTRSVPTTRRYS